MVIRTLAISVAVCLAWGSAAQDRPVVRIATEGGFPPFNYVDANNEPQGFEVDLAKALCEAMAVTCIIVLQEWGQHHRRARGQALRRHHGLDADHG
jgi:ABC-type amino acid transport substrate-binding protein